MCAPSGADTSGVHRIVLFAGVWLLLAAPAGARVLGGSRAADVLRGGSRADRLSGGFGRDRLFGLGGGDVLRGDSGVRMENILGPYHGVSEQRLHAAFDEARAAAPCVLFIDEIDALAFARRKQSGAGRTLVDQLLQELDAIGADNAGMLVLAATNAPWDVDDAVKRPGRFDRVIFVPPPDEEARRRVLDIVRRDRPVGDIHVSSLANTPQTITAAVTPASLPAMLQSLPYMPKAMTATRKPAIPPMIQPLRLGP